MDLATQIVTTARTIGATIGATDVSDSISRFNKRKAACLPFLLDDSFAERQKDRHDRVLFLIAAFYVAVGPSTSGQTPSWRAI